MPDIFEQNKDNQNQAQNNQGQQEQQTQNQQNPEEQQQNPEGQQQPNAPTQDQTREEQFMQKLSSPEETSREDAKKHLYQVLQKTGQTVGLWTHYCENPSGVKFVNQEADEDILLFVRRHFITNVPWIIIFILLTLFPIIIFALFKISNFTLFSIPASLVIILLAFYYLIIINYALLNFIDWFYDIGMVTRKRVLDLDSENILQHHMAETEIEDIVDVAYTQRGFMQSFFNYGDIHIQLQAIKTNFEFEATPKPTEVSDIITDLKVVVKGH